MRLRATPSKGAGTLAVMAAQPDQPRHPRSPRALVRALVGVTASLSLVVAGISAYAYVGYMQAQDSVGIIPDVPSSSAGAQTPDFGPCVDDVCNYLILGSDSRAGLTADEQNQFGTDEDIGGSNRSDVIMLVHTDPRLQKAIVLSFPRDLWVDIPGRGFDKINAAFSGGLEGGGAQLVAKTVEELSGLKINHVLYVDLAGFQGIVEALGGVTMCIPTAMTDPLTGLDVQAGCQTLDGYQALAYVRTRHQPCDLDARLRADQPSAAVPARRPQPAPVAERDREGAVVDPAGRAQPGDDEGVRSGGRHLSREAARGHLDRRGGVPGGARRRRLRGIVVRPVSGPRRGPDLRSHPQGRAAREPRASTSQSTAPSEANIVVPVVDHDSGGTADDVEQILSDAGFDISPGIVDYATYGADVKGSVIAYKPGHQSDAEVVQKYFPNLQLLEVPASALRGSPVAVFISGSFHLEPVGSGAPSTDCIAPDA